MEARRNPGERPAGDSKTPISSERQSLDQREHRPLLYLLLLFFVLAAGIITAGFLFYRTYARNYRGEVERELSSIAELKAGQLVRWRKERLADASVFYRNKAFSGLVEGLLKTPADVDVRGRILSWLNRVQDAYQYDRVFILDAQGIERLAVPGTTESVASHLLQQIPEILGSDKITFLDFHRDTPDRPIHLALVVPVRDEADGSRPLGVLVLRIDPAAYLYPFIQQWPSPSRTAETLLVRREGNEVLFLNELRFQKNAALNLRIPLGRLDLPAAMAALGQRGIVEGVDYRGVPVFADVRGIPDSPWFLVTRIDATEANAPLQERLWMIIGLVATLLFGAGAGVGLIWRQQRLRFVQERLAAVKRIYAVSSRQEALLSAVPDIIMEVNRNKVYTWANPAGIEFFGEDVVGKEAAFYFEGEQETYQKVKPLLNGHEDVIYVESWQRRKDGEKRLLAWWCRVLLDEDGRVTGALSSARDITEHKRAEDALKASEERFRNLFNNAVEGVFKTTSEGRFIAANMAFARMLGYESPEEIIRTVTDIAHQLYADPDERKIAVSILRETGFLKGFECQMRKKDGSVIWVSANVRLNESPDGDSNFEGFITDITRRKLAEEALRRAEENFRHSLDDSPFGVRIVSAEGETTYANRAILDLYGFSSLEELRTTPVKKRYTPESYAEFKKRYERRQRGEDSPSEYEVSIVKKNGEVRHLLVSRKELFWNGKKQYQTLYRDITDRRQVEAKLRESEEKYRAFIETNQEWIWQINNEGIHTYSNPAIEQILGYSIKDIVGKNATIYMHPEDRREIEGKLPKWIEKKTGWKNLVVRWLHKDGSIRWLESNAVPMLDVQGELTGFQGSDRDITERKRAEEALRSSLREKEVLLREVHHRVKNNMQVISSLFNLQAEYTISKECREILKEGQTRIRSMSLVHEKLYQSRDLSKIDLAGYIEGLAAHLFHVYLVNPAQVRMETEYEDVSVDINSAVPCGLILNELISNALKHAFPEGRTGVIKIGLRREPGGAVELRVADDGVGLPEGLDFRKAESFGLQIVNLLVDQLEAAIDLDRTNGTAVTVTFRELKYALRV